MSNQVPDATQIRAAMAMLSWENDDLAKAADIAASSVHNIKRGLTRPQPRILAAIRATFEAQGLEFIDNSGVRHKPEGIDVLNGKEGVISFFDKVYQVAQTEDRPFLQNVLDDNALIAPAEDYVHKHIQRMSILHNEKKSLKVLVISETGTKDFGNCDYAEYRWHPTDIPPPVPYYVFGDHLAIFTFQSDPSPKIFVIHSAAIAEAYRTQFIKTWEISNTPAMKRGVK